MADKDKDFQEFADRLRLEGINCKGYGLIPKYPMRDQELSITAKAIYAYFCAMSGDGDTSFPSVKTIISHLRLNEQTYRKHREQLCVQGYLVVEETRKNGGFHSNIFTLISNPKKFQELEPKNDWQRETYNTIEHQGLKAAGFGVIPRTVMQDPRMDTGAKALYAYLSSFAGNGKAPFPSVPQVCLDLGISKGTYQTKMRILIQMGYVEVKQENWGENPSSKRGFGRNHYILIDNPIESQHKISRTAKSSTDISCSEESRTGIPSPEKSMTVESDTVKSRTEESGTRNSSTTNNNTSTKNTNTKNISIAKNINQSIITHPQEKRSTDRMNSVLSVETEFIKKIRENVEYSRYLKIFPYDNIRLVDDLIRAMASVCRLPSDAPVRIGGQPIPAEDVRNRFLSLTSEHMHYVVTSLEDRIMQNETEIRNKRAYQLTTLYNAVETLESFYMVEQG